MSDWYVVYTHAQAETRAVANLQRQSYRTYLPVYRKIRRHARRRELVSRPLFPRYLFVWLDVLSTQWRPILSTIGVCQLLMRDSRPLPVPEGVIEGIWGAESNGVFDRDPGQRFGTGDSVRIMEGPFADLVGRFVGLADSERVFVLLDLMERQVKVCLGADALSAA